MQYCVRGLAAVILIEQKQDVKSKEARVKNQDKTLI